MYTRKQFHAFVAPFIKAAHLAVNAYCVNQPFVQTPGMVVTHGSTEAPKAGAIEWEGFTVEISMCRRARVVCGVPTPFSLFTFNYCLKRDGKQITHGATLPEFVDHVMRHLRKQGLAR